MYDYYRLVTAIGPGFHPDTPGAAYASLPTGYTPAAVDAIVDRASWTIDPALVALAILEGEFTLTDAHNADPTHRAYTADYCPLCGTARKIGG